MRGRSTDVNECEQISERLIINPWVKQRGLLKVRGCYVWNRGLFSKYCYQRIDGTGRFTTGSTEYVWFRYIRNSKGVYEFLGIYNNAVI